jgi:hypothetical protein
MFLQSVRRRSEGLLIVSASGGVVLWNLLRTASLFFSQIPVAEKDFKTRGVMNEDFQVF